MEFQRLTSPKDHPRTWIGGCSSAIWDGERLPYLGDLRSPWLLWPLFIWDDPPSKPKNPLVCPFRKRWSTDQLLLFSDRIGPQQILFDWNNPLEVAFNSWQERKPLGVEFWTNFKSLQVSTEKNWLVAKIRGDYINLPIYTQELFW